MKRIVAINGGYRREGVTFQAVAEAAGAAREAGAEVRVIDLLDARIEFCTNCRSCTQVPGEKRGACVLADDMAGILDAVDAADGLILAAPVNYFNVTALMRRFLERTIPYAWWPWGRPGPKLRLGKLEKQAVLVTSSAMPAAAGFLFTGALRALGTCARSFGAKRAGSLFIGMASMKEKPQLTPGEKAKARRLGRLLAA